MHRVASRQNPIVARYRAAARGEADGVILLDGTHLVGDALAAGLRIREAAVAADAGAEALALARRLENAGVETVSATAPVLAALSQVRSPSDVVALADRPKHDRSALLGAAPLVIVAFDVQDPGNVGAIVRVAEAGGATGVVIAGVSADPFGWKALRGSMGSALRLPLLVERHHDVAADLRAQGLRIVATAPRGGRSLVEIDLTGPVAVIVGGEGAGLSAAQLADADEPLTIPMRSPVESLNTAVTAALIVYEAQRQRSKVRT